jgi:hypothetical protein
MRLCPTKGLSGRRGTQTGNSLGGSGCRPGALAREDPKVSQTFPTHINARTNRRLRHGKSCPGAVQLTGISFTRSGLGQALLDGLRYIGGILWAGADAA